MDSPKPKLSHLLPDVAFLGLTNTLRWLLSSGRVPLSAINEMQFPCTPIVVAVHSGCIDTVQYLIDLGVELDADDMMDVPSVIGTAVEDGNIAILQLLINAGANISHQAWSGGALVLASDAGHEAIVRILLDAGADVNKESVYGKTAIARAAEGGHTEVVRMLVQAGADAKLGCVATALSWAASSGCTETVRLLISAGVDVNHCEIRGEFDPSTALQRAVVGSHTEIVQILLEAGADPNRWVKYGSYSSPLEMANAVGLAEIASLLIRHGAYLGARPQRGWNCDCDSGDEYSSSLEAGSNL
jgi:uncharacterized protein